MGKRSVRNKNFFVENYSGILTHEGTIKVAKTEITARILHISDKTVLVRGTKPHGYHAEIHRDMYPLMRYVETGDTAFIKWKSGTPWFVGFKKNKNSNRNVIENLDSYFINVEM